MVHAFAIVDRRLSAVVDGDARFQDLVEFLELVALSLPSPSRSNFANALLSICERGVEFPIDFIEIVLWLIGFVSAGPSPP
jgi:hypothetical protein